MIEGSKWGSLFKAAASGRESGGVRRRVFAAYAGIALLMFGLAAATALWQSHTNVSPKTSMKRMAASVSPQFFIDMLGMEAASMKRPGETTFSGSEVGSYLAKLLIHVNPNEPKSLLASEMPAMRGAKLPPASQEEPAGQAAGPETAVKSVSSEEAGSAATVDNATPQPVVAQGGQPDPTPTKLNTGSRKVIFVYHSHPRESWVPELNVRNANEAENAQTNITLVGKRLADKLEQQGVGSQHSNTDYPTAVQGYNWNYSYKYSLQTVKDAVQSNKDITFLFDIHRDSAARDVTTAKIGDADYAKVYFIVGKKNEHWEQNEAFAKRIHEKLETSYPGLSRGIWDKGSGGHAEYNQSVSPNSILIEVGGPYNTLEECYRTADVLAETIATIYWEVEKVNASAKANEAGHGLIAVNR